MEARLMSQSTYRVMMYPASPPAWIVLEIKQGFLGLSVESIASFSSRLSAEKFIEVLRKK
jgi:hypothetical protein